MRTFDTIQRELLGAVHALHGPNAPHSPEFQAKLGKLIVIASDLLTDEKGRGVIQKAAIDHHASHQATVDADRAAKAEKWQQHASNPDRVNLEPPAPDHAPTHKHEEATGLALHPIGG